MKYVGNNQIAFDPQSLGFPSVMGCQAVIYHTSRGLYGLHDMKTGKGYFTAPHPLANDAALQTEVDAGKSATFAAWFRIVSHARETGIALYGVINQEHQYSRDDDGAHDWSRMLHDVAKALHFNGPIYGARITSHVAPNDSLYIQATIAGEKVQIDYKRMSKMEFDAADPGPADTREHRLLIRNPVGGDATNFDADQLGPVGTSLARRVVRTGGGAMNLHRVSRLRMTRFRS